MIQTGVNIWNGFPGFTLVSQYQHCNPRTHTVNPVSILESKDPHWRLKILTGIPISTLKSQDQHKKSTNPHQKSQDPHCTPPKNHIIYFFWDAHKRSEPNVVSNFINTLGSDSFNIDHNHIVFVSFSMQNYIFLCRSIIYTMCHYVITRITSTVISIIFKIVDFKD